MLDETAQLDPIAWENKLWDYVFFGVSLEEKQEEPVKMRVPSGNPMVYGL